jgi:hypothetical protein
MANTAGTVPEPGGRTYTLLGVDRHLYRSAVPGRFGGHRKSRIYGRLDCPAALRAIVSPRVPEPTLARDPAASQPPQLGAALPGLAAPSRGINQNSGARTS